MVVTAPHFEYRCKTCDNAAVNDDCVQWSDVDGNRKLVHLLCGEPVRLFVTYDGEGSYYAWCSRFPDPAMIEEPVENVPAVCQPQAGYEDYAADQQR